MPIRRVGSDSVQTQDRFEISLGSITEVRTAEKSQCKGNSCQATLTERLEDLACRGILGKTMTLTNRDDKQCSLRRRLR